jgi:hypothetical protein
VYKCEAYGLTHSEASGWRISYRACGLYSKPFDWENEKTMIEYLKHKGKPTEVVKGQIDMFGGDSVIDQAITEPKELTQMTSDEIKAELDRFVEGAQWLDDKLTDVYPPKTMLAMLEKERSIRGGGPSAAAYRLYDANNHTGNNSPSMRVFTVATMLKIAQRAKEDKYDEFYEFY